jgi:transcriptional regulator with XRE-family HTH domain
MSMPICAKTMRRLRQERGISRNMLAKEAKVDYRVIMDMERGSNYRISTLVRIAAALNMRPGKLLDELMRGDEQ